MSFNSEISENNLRRCEQKPSVSRHSRRLSVEQDEDCQREYAKSPTEKMIYQLIYDVVLAPIVAATKTILSLSLNLMILFGLTAASFRLFTDIFNSFYTDNKLSIIWALVTTSVLLLLYCSFFPKYPSILLGSFVSGSTLLAGSIAVYLGQDSTLSVGTISALSSAAAATFYWLFIEKNQKTMAAILCHHYERSSSLKPRKKQKGS